MEAISKLVEMTKATGSHYEYSEWSKAKVFWFDELMPNEVRMAGSSDPTVEHFNSDGTPHTPAGEGFIDRQSNTAISFLLTAK
jgi:hypothetical protein